MSIGWAYLDKKDAATKALRDKNAMQHIIVNTPNSIIQAHDRMTALHGSNLSAPVQKGQKNSGEDRIVKAIDEIDVLNERYRQAIEYMDWFIPAWSALNDSERYVLEAFYITNNFGNNAVYTVCDHFHIERSSAYNKKNRALEHLATLLYGKI